MPFALKTTGVIAGYTVLAAAIVNEAGDSVQDLVTGNTINVHASVAYGVDTWNGVNRGYFRPSGSGFTPHTVTWTGRSVPFTGTGHTTIVIMRGHAGGANHSGATRRILVDYDASTGYFEKMADGATEKAAVSTGSSAMLVATPDALGNTKSAYYFRFTTSSNGIGIRQRAMAGAFGSESVGTDSGFLTGANNLRSLAGNGESWWEPEIFAVLIVAGVMDVDDADEIVDDFFAALVEAPAGPTLSAPTKSTPTSTTAVVGFTTDGTNGTARAVLTLDNAQPSIAQVKAGQDAAGSSATTVVPTALTITSAGAKNFAAAAVVAGTTRYGWIVHTNGASLDSAVLPTGPLYPGTGRGVEDISAASYTASSGSDLFAMIDEDSPGSDADYINSPTLTGSLVDGPIFRLSQPYPAGTYPNVKVRKWVTGGSAGQFRIKFLNDSNTLVGQTDIQAMTGSATTYTLSVTLSGTATRFQIAEGE